MRNPIDGRLHFSELRAFAKSPVHYAHACAEAKKPTDAMLVGSVADAIVFGNKGYAVYPGPKRAGKEWDLFQSANAGQILCLQSHFDKAAGAAQAVLRDEMAQRCLDGCEFQTILQWDISGIPCAAGIAGVRGGFDAINHRTREIWDLKVTHDTHPDRLMRHAWNMLWHCQGAWYVDGWAEAIEASASELPYSFGLIAVEANPPHVVTVLKMPPPVLDQGRKSIRLWVERYLACEAVDEWPGYVQVAVEMAVPTWIETEEEAGDE
jgi:hypothetical protein